jgi:hypothetical protein
MSLEVQLLSRDASLRTRARDRRRITMCTMQYAEQDHSQTCSEFWAPGLDAARSPRLKGFQRPDTAPGVESISTV